MQNLTTSVTSLMQAIESRPLILIEISLDDGDLRYATSKANVVWPTGGNTYYARPIMIDQIDRSINTQIVEVQVSIDNSDGSLHSYNYAERFNGKNLTIRKVYYPFTAVSSDYREVFKGKMSEPKFIDKKWCDIIVRAGSSLDRRVAQEYYNVPCQHIPGDEQCNHDDLLNVNSLSYSGTITGAGQQSIFDTSLTQADDYWNYGKILMTIGNVIYYRRVKDFINATGEVIFDVPMHTSVNTGTTYTIRKGCPKTLYACQANAAYGPSADNSANFKGFIHLGEK